MTIADRPGTLSPIELPRCIDLATILARKSLFLLGPGQTGKTWLLRQQRGGARTYNLLDHQVHLQLSRAPERLQQEISAEDSIVVVDEIQKLPQLLDEVQLLIDQRGTRFLLTGSSARKLRRRGVNLRGGRALTRTLHPLVFPELGEHLDLQRPLYRGLIPSIYFSADARDDLAAYCGSYLTEEIAAEGLTRNVPAFSRFLRVAALCNGQLLNYAKIANDAQVARSTVQEYFAILQDTLLAFELPPWGHSVRRKPLSTSKLYFFDVGVARALQNRGELSPGTPEFGAAFEHYMFHELKSYADYRRIDSLCYLRSKSGFEVDFVLADATAIEIKASTTVSSRDLAGLRALRQEGKLKHFLLVCMEDRRRLVDSIEVLPWREFLQSLWDDAWR